MATSTILGGISARLMSLMRVVRVCGRTLMSEMDYEVLFAEAAQGLGQPRREAAVRAARVGSKRSFRIAARARRPLALAHAAAPRPLARRRVRLCTRGHSTVCTSGQKRRHSASLVSDFAHANRRRVHKRTRNRPNRHPRVWKSTRTSVPCAQADKSGTIRPGTCPTLHTRRRPVCTSGQKRRHSASLVSDFAHAIRQRVH